MLDIVMSRLFRDREFAIGRWNKYHAKCILHDISQYGTFGLMHSELTRQLVAGELLDASLAYIHWERARTPRERERAYQQSVRKYVNKQAARVLMHADFSVGTASYAEKAARNTNPLKNPYIWVYECDYDRTSVPLWHFHGGHAYVAN